MTDSLHDPGAATAGARAPEDVTTTLEIYGADVRTATASWTDRTMPARGVFYPDDAKTPEARLRYYASRFSLVEADAGFYAIPDPETTARWVERTPQGFVFDVKAHALMTGHATELARLPRSIRDLLPSETPARVYAKDLSVEIRDEVWRQFRVAFHPLHEAGKLGAVLLQFAPWIRPTKHTPAMLTRARE